MEWKRVNGEQWGSDSKRRKKQQKNKLRKVTPQELNSPEEINPVQTLGRKSKTWTETKKKKAKGDPVMCYISLLPQPHNENRPESQTSGS